MEDAELDDEGEADKGEGVKTYQEERRPRRERGCESATCAERIHQPSVLVSQEGAGKTSEDENCAKDAKGRINFRCENGGGSGRRCRRRRINA